VVWSLTAFLLGFPLPLAVCRLRFLLARLAGLPITLWNRLRIPFSKPLTEASKPQAPWAGHCKEKPAPEVAGTRLSPVSQRPCHRLQALRTPIPPRGGAAGGGGARRIRPEVGREAPQRPRPQPARGPGTLDRGPGQGGAGRCPLPSPRRRKCAPRAAGSPGSRWSPGGRWSTRSGPWPPSGRPPPLARAGAPGPRAARRAACGAPWRRAGGADAGRGEGRARGVDAWGAGAAPGARTWMVRGAPPGGLPVYDFPDPGRAQTYVLSWDFLRVHRACRFGAPSLSVSSRWPRGQVCLKLQIIFFIWLFTAWIVFRHLCSSFFPLLRLFLFIHVQF
jgi:hypothetical protein